MATLDITTIKEDLSFLDDWEERYRYIIDLGKALEPLAGGTGVIRVLLVQR